MIRIIYIMELTDMAMGAPQAACQIVCAINGFSKRPHVLKPLAPTAAAASAPRHRRRLGQHAKDTVGGIAAARVRFVTLQISEKVLRENRKPWYLTHTGGDGADSGHVRECTPLADGPYAAPDAKARPRTGRSHEGTEDPKIWKSPPISKKGFFERLTH